MNKKELNDQLILKRDETALSLIKEMRALSNVLYKKTEDRNHAMHYQYLRPKCILSEIDYSLYRIEGILDAEIDYMKQQIEKKKGGR